MNKVTYHLEVSSIQTLWFSPGACYITGNKVKSIKNDVSSHDVLNGWEIDLTVFLDFKIFTWHPTDS